MPDTVARAQLLETPTQMINYVNRYKAGRGSLNVILYVKDSADISALDQILIDLLEEYGHAVTPATDNDANSADQAYLNSVAATYDICVIAESVNSGYIAPLFDLAIPIVTCELGNYDEFGFSSNANATNQAAYKIENAGHPILSGLGYANGDFVPVPATVGEMQGILADGLTSLVVDAADSGESPLCLLEKNATTRLLGASPELRIFIGGNSPTAWSTTWKDLFRRCVAYAGGLPTAS